MSTFAYCVAPRDFDRLVPGCRLTALLGKPLCAVICFADSPPAAGGAGGRAAEPVIVGRIYATAVIRIW